MGNNLENWAVPSTCLKQGFLVFAVYAGLAGPGALGCCPLSASDPPQEHMIADASMLRLPGTNGKYLLSELCPQPDKHLPTAPYCQPNIFYF